MPQQKLYSFTKAYHFISILIMALTGLSGVAMLVFYFLLRPEFVNYGNDAIGGWATIYSGIFYLTGGFAKYLFLFGVFLSLITIVYFLIGNFINRFLKNKLELQQPSAYGIGNLLAVWTLVPGFVTLRNIFDNLNSFPITRLVIPLLSFGTAIYLFKLNQDAKNN